MLDSERVRVLHGNANPDLARRVAARLNVAVGRITVGAFSDGETRVELHENMRGRDIFILQSTCYPVNQHLMELVFMVDACRRASARQITVVMPYAGYSRQDRRVRSARVPISARVVADMLQTVGMTRLITVDLHADQIQGFYYAPVDNIYASLTLFEQDNLLERVDSPVVVSPDVGGVVRARALAKRLDGSDLAIIDKRRERANSTEVMNIIGDVQDRDCIIVDDMVDTAGTLCEGTNALLMAGARSVRAYCVHPVLSGPAIERISQSKLVELIVDDTIELSEAAKNCAQIRVVPLCGLLAETISRVNKHQSVSSLFVDSD